MKTLDSDYSLFHRFIETYLPVRYKGIDQESPLMLEIEDLMERNDQFFYVADAINMKILFTSRRSLQMLGVEPEDLSFYHFMEATHPNDIQRLNIGRMTLIKMSQDIFIDREGSALLTTNFRIRNAAGKYPNILCQNYLFYSSTPYKTAYFIKIHTNIDWCKKIKHGYHYYIGKDLSFFRYPDKKMMQMGTVFTKREFEIIKMIAEGLNTEQISKKLFLSIYTVNTHRGNILKKTQKSSISDLIHELRERGVI